MIKFSKAIGYGGATVLPLFCTFFGYYIAAKSALYFAQGQEGIAMLWPASGLLLAVLLIISRQRAASHIAAAAMASFLANVEANNSAFVSAGFTFANMTESFFAAWLLRTKGKGRISFTDPGGLKFFYVATTTATMLSATIACVVVPNASVGLWFSWFSTDLLGALVVTPVILIVVRSFKRKRFRAEIAALPKALTALAIVAIVTAITFAQSSYPLLFMPMLAVLFATFRIGPLGAAGGILIVATVSSIAANSGSGPQILMKPEPLLQSLFLQFYLLMLFAATLPVATLLAARERLVVRLNNKMRLLQLAESAANVGHWRLNIVDQKVTWSEEVYRIHGIASDDPPMLDKAIEAYHPDDRDEVSAHIDRAIERSCGFEFTARIVRPNGEIRHVFSKGEIDHTDTDEAPGLFGIVQDITTQIANERMIEDARVRAEMLAAEATKLAETDQLTGIANRRRTTDVLNKAIDASQNSRQPLSIAMFDIDYFKRVNDTYGHAAGDKVLMHVAVAAAAELRDGDTIGRFGGEEFVIILPNATSENAVSIAERIRRVIEKADIDPCVTISVGVAELIRGELADTLLNRADQALYAGKRKGRNTMHLAA